VTGHSYRVVSRREPFQGAIFSVVSDEVTMPGGGTARRDWTRHLGAAAVVALDESGRIVLVRQYRHPVGRHMWEIPAGLIDVAGESGVETAKRELAEEADFTATRWDLLVEAHTSPGFSDELVRVFLARDLTPVPEHERHQREHEEADMTVRLVDLDEAVAMVFRSEITNSSNALGILAAARARDEAWAPLRPADTPPPLPPPGLTAAPHGQGSSI
jgi:8-oxo-dGTP pyrophosphatase MutT (NUDIX family)